MVLSLDPGLFAAIRQRAAERGLPANEVVAEALHEAFLGTPDLEELDLDDDSGSSGELDDEESDWIGRS